MDDWEKTLQAEIPEENKKYICKICKVQVVSKTDHRAILGKVHLKHCRRKRLM
jgi:hypothetical protein